jgi:hypothetical protein
MSTYHDLVHYLELKGIPVEDKDTFYCGKLDRVIAMVEQVRNDIRDSGDEA